MTDFPPEVQEAMSHLQKRHQEYLAARRANKGIHHGDFIWWNAEEPPLEVWEHKGILCAVAAGGVQPGLNGYVQLPKDHPWVDIDLSHGYEHGIEIDVHGGITFGIDGTRWIGFDTAHFGDTWDFNFLESLPLSPARLDRWRKLKEILNQPPFPEDRWTRHWTIEELRTEVEHLAEQVKRAADG